MKSNFKTFKPGSAGTKTAHGLGPGLYTSKSTSKVSQYINEGHFTSYSSGYGNGVLFKVKVALGKVSTGLGASEQDDPKYDTIYYDPGTRGTAGSTNWDHEEMVHRGRDANGNVVTDANTIPPEGLVIPQLLPTNWIDIQL